MVGLVVVSHSAGLAAGVVELARQMGGEDVAIEPAGGMAEPEGAIGTDAVLVQAAIGRAASPDGVLVLMDLGSAVMSAEMAAEMVAAEDGPPVLLCEAPLVEGAVAAAARARTGASLEEVAAEARSALGMKAAQLGVEPAPAAAAPAAAPAAGGEEARLPVGNPLGLHARPAARFVATASRFDAEVAVTNETSGSGPVDARSLSALVTLGVRQGHTIVVRAAGREAGAALAALRELADTGYGDDGEGEPASTAEPPAAPQAPAAAPAAGAVLRGVAAAPGIAIGPARRPAAAPAPPAADEPPVGSPEAERERLEQALVAARTDLEAARAEIAERAGEAEAAIFDAHALLLADAALLEPARRAVADGLSAAAAWRAAVAGAVETWQALDDPYLRERAADVEDAGARVLRRLGAAPAAPVLTQPGILVAEDVTPGDAAALDRDLVQGLAVARGGATSHAAILARALGIPSVVGLGDALLGVEDGTPLVLDGLAGVVEVEPPAEALAERERARAAAERRRLEVRRRAHEPARTRDGTRVEVAANVGSAADAAAAVELGAEGVGLLRTEFLFLDRAEAPGEEEQRQVYAAIAAAMGGRRVVVRTLDAGADKPLPFLRQAPEENPFLGVRGIRLALAYPELLRTQLRAILAVAAEHPVSVMFPMVTTIAEYRAARAIADEAQAELGVPPVEVGVMVEVPAVALQAGLFAREVDFFSVGTNDLTQYVTAAERGNGALAELLAGPVPAVLRLVAAVTRGAQAHGRWVGVCGELAGDPAGAALLVGLGATELSMAASRIPEVKAALRGLALADARAAAERALDAADAREAAELAAPLLAAPRPLVRADGPSGRVY